MPRPRRIGIVEDDAHLRRYLNDVVDADPRLEVAFTEGDMAGALRRIETLAVDLWLIDLQLPDGNGADLVPRLKARGKAKCLILTVLGDRTSVIAALDSGADGYLLKDTDPKALVEGILSALDGYAPISPQAAHFLLDLYQQGTRQARQRPEDSVLTTREQEVLRLFSRGLSYREAAGVLEISPHTVRDYVKAIYRKLSVHSRSEAIFEARQLGIISSVE
ncbi:response regulator transcription factor [Brevundimonas sp.]|uniref:response regulator transcription factor n=1 Tax=Brevundimonas sp. TaxID=1871086 RepID=UPI002AC957F9|nr:response regulator transcription factor [Brevundimonas sp.]